MLAKQWAVRIVGKLWEGITETSLFRLTQPHSLMTATRSTCQSSCIRRNKRTCLLAGSNPVARSKSQTAKLVISKTRVINFHQMVQIYLIKPGVVSIILTVALARSFVHTTFLQTSCFLIQLWNHIEKRIRALESRLRQTFRAYTSN